MGVPASTNSGDLPSFDRLGRGSRAGAGALAELVPDPAIELAEGIAIFGDGAAATIFAGSEGLAAEGKSTSSCVDLEAAMLSMMSSGMEAAMLGNDGDFCAGKLIGSA